MTQKFDLKTNVRLGVVPTHLKFVGGLAPDEHGKMPRGEDGKLLVVSNMAGICAASAVKLGCVQVPVFFGLSKTDTEELVTGLRELDLEVHFILMVGGADPMNPEDEDAVTEILVSGLSAAIGNDIAHVSSTSIEEWMQPGATRREGESYQAAIAQNAKVHARACREANVNGSCVEAWHIEFLRDGEFKTFTDIRRAGEVVAAMNDAWSHRLFKVLVDAAHCGDSQLSVPDNVAAIRDIASAGDLGIFHASAKTTRGCLSTDDGWIGALLAAVAETGNLRHVFVEVFHHEDPALEALRALDARHGIDTTDGRDYDQVVLDGLSDIGRRLNSLGARKLLQ